MKLGDSAAISTPTQAKRISRPSAASSQGAAPPPPTDFLTLTGLVPTELAPLAPFRYDGTALPNLTRAGQSGALTGAQANAQVTGAYHQLDQAMSAYLGEPATANWLTFGKYASREAGVQIADLEATFDAMSLEASGLKRMVASFSDAERLTQSMKAMQAAFEGYQATLPEAGLLQRARQEAAFGAYFLGQLDKLHRSLVSGNIRVYGHIAPAFDRFMAAEAAGRDGLKALKEAGYGHAPLDPQGFVLDGFAAYREARRLRDAAAAPGLSSEERLELLAERQAAIGRANLLMVVNEQWTIVQGPDVFGDPDIARLTEAMGGTMSIVDALGEHRLLPDGGNWTDFATRMGFTEVTPGSVPNAIVITDERGKRRDYAPKTYASREGTIFSYFEENLSESRSRRMIETAPAPVPGVKMTMKE